MIATIGVGKHLYRLAKKCYEEARAIGEMNAANPGVRIILGGTTIHSGDSFMAELGKLSAPAAGHAPGARATGGLGSRPVGH